MASLVDDIARIEATSYEGVGVEKVYLHEGADVTPRRLAARQQRAGGAQVHAAEHHPAAGAALRRDRRADHPAQPRRATRCPIPRSTISGRTSSARRSRWCTAPRCRIRTAASRASSWPTSTSRRCRRAACRPPDVSDALQTQNVILPAGDVKIGSKDYTRGDEQQPRRHRARSTPSPSSRSTARTVFMRDVAHVHDGFQVQTNSVSVERHARRADDDPQDRRRLDAGGDRRHPRGAAGNPRTCCPRACASSRSSISRSSSRRRSTAC